MDRVRQQQEESLEERERLVMEMEEQQQLTHREKEESENMKKRREEEIRSQVCYLSNIKRIEVVNKIFPIEKFIRHDSSWSSKKSSSKSGNCVVCI